MWDNNPDWYKHEAPKYQPKWEKDVNYNPDARPSASRVITGTAGNRMVRIYQVRGFGVLVLSAGQDPAPDGTLQFNQMAILTKDDIGYAPNL